MSAPNVGLRLQLPVASPLRRRLVLLPVAVVLLTLAGVAPAAAAPYDWQHDINDYYGSAQYRPLAADDSGEYTTTATTITKWLPSGSQLWHTTVEINGAPGAISGLASDATGLYVVGSTTGDHLPLAPFVARLTPDGDFVWSRHFDVPTTYPEGALGIEAGVALGPGVVYIGGSYYPDGFLAALSRDGGLLWEEPIAYYGEFYGAIAAAADGVAIAGADRGYDENVWAYRQDGSLRWTRGLNAVPQALASDGAGGYYSGDSSTVLGGYAADVIHFDAAGALVRRHHLATGSGDAHVTGIATFGDEVFADWNTSVISTPRTYRHGWSVMTMTLSGISTHSFGSGSDPVELDRLAANARGGYAFHSDANASTVQFVRFRLDAENPLSQWQAAYLPPHFFLDDGSVLTQLRWSGSDTGSGIDHFVVQRSANAGPWSTVKISNPRSVQQLLDVTPGGKIRFHVRAVDKQGNVSAWSTSPSYQFKLVQEGSASIKYAGDWASAKVAAASNGVVMTSSTAGDSATFTFNGDAFTFVSIIGPDRGKLSLRVDGGKPSIVDLQAAKQAGPFAVFGQRWSSVGKHSVVMRVLGTQDRPRVDLDAFETLATQ